ncbi:MAG: hypothetical protein HKN29_00380 [Rhodothermales bacterium]|nr:hypothetical protein [Rhodothermales bacterium]
MATPITHFSRRALRAFGGVALLGLVVFFAATRTEIGRDAVARQVEAQFARSTNGQLIIGKLTGNLVQAFTATDVRILSAEGRTLLAVDTILASPSWSDMLRRRFDTRRIELRRPRLQLESDSTGRSRWASLLPRSEGGSRASGWSFESARIVVVDGVVTTPLLGDPVSRRILGQQLNLDARIERLESAYLFNVRDASGQSTDGAVTVQTASGQAVVDSNSVVINQVRVISGNSDIDVAGSWMRDQPDRFSVDLRRSRVSFDEVASFWPESPLRGLATLEASVSGQTNDFVISRVALQTGRSRAELSGTVVGWPDSAMVDLSTGVQPLLRRDFDRLLPRVPLPERLVVDSLFATGTLAGTILGPARDAAFSTTAGTRGGTLSATGQLTDEEDGLRITGRLEPTNVDLGRLYLTSTASTSITGSTDFDVVLADDMSRVAGGVAGTLTNTRLGTSRIDRMVLAATIDGASGFGEARLFQPEGTATLTADWSGQRANLVGTAASLDLGPLLGQDSLFTKVHGALTASISDAGSRYGTVSIQVDSASVRTARGTSTLRDQSLTADLGREDSLLVLALRGSELQGRIVTDVDAPTASLGLRFWSRALRNAASREANKPLHAAPARTDTAELQAAILRDEFRQAFQRVGSVRANPDQPLSISGNLALQDLGRLQSWRPGGPPLTGSAALTVSLRSDLNVLETDMSLSSDSLGRGGSVLHALQAGLSLETDYNGPVEDALVLELTARSDSLLSPVSSLPSLHLTAAFSDRAGSVAVQSGRGSRLGPLNLNAQLQLQEDRNRVRLDSLGFAARQLRWSLDRPAILDVFSDGLTVEGLALSEEVASQRLILDGTISDAPQDTLAVTARSLRLAEITEFGQLRRELGGLLSADIQLTGGLARPRMDGNIRVPTFIMDDRMLGNLRLDLSLSADRDAVGVDLTVTPLTVPTAVPAVSEVIDNRLTLAGSVRLPSGNDEGAWDLDLGIERGDLFFLKYIFNESADRFDGYLVGGGRVSGPFAKPIVDASAEAFDGEFGIVKTGVRYFVDGAVRIDREAIHFDRASLRDQDGGSAELTGRMYFNDYRFFSFDIQGELDELLVMNRSETEDLPFYGFIRGTGQATLTGPLTNATLRVPNGYTRADSELFIPIVDTIEEGDASFIIFADSTGRRPDIQRLIRRPFVLARRASSERQFLDGLDMDLNIDAPRGSLIHLVIDPLLGDVINAESTGRVQIRRNQGEFGVYGQMEVLGGDYLFTAGEVFVRRFTIEPGGTLSWVGDPVNARMDLSAIYRTRASTTGLDDVNLGGALIPLIVELQISGLVASPNVDLGLSIDRSNQNALGDYQALEARLNQPDRATEYATSVLLTNSFQLTTDNLTAGAGEQLAFNSVSQLVSSQLSRFLDAALPNVDFNFGLQGERAEDLDITYGVALRLLDERLIIRGEGIYQGSSTDNTRANTQGIQGEFVVEVRLSPSVSAQVFFRREGDILQNADLTNTAGAGLTYQTDFPSWRQALRRLFGRGEAQAVIPPAPPDDDER